MTHTTPIHPREHLAEMLAELGVSQYRLARTIGVPPRRINEIVHGRRSVTADTALRIGRALGTTPEFWLNLQRMYDLDMARNAADVSRIEPLVGAGHEPTSLLSGSAGEAAQPPHRRLTVHHSRERSHHHGFPSPHTSGRVSTVTVSTSRS